MVSSLPQDLQEDVYEKVNLFRDPENHPGLKVHKLKGALKGFSSFSVNYKTRIIFETVRGAVILHAVGDHGIYKN